MQEEIQNKSLQIGDLTLEERARLVNFFVWLIAQDKKQNPALYQSKSKRND